MTRYGGLVALPGLETSGGSLALQPTEQLEIADVVGRVRLAVGSFLGCFENERHAGKLRVIDQKLEGCAANLPLADGLVPVDP